MSEPYIRKDAGDIMLAADWNQMQIQARDEIHKHAHTGGDDGTVLGRSAIAANAIDGSKIDPASDVVLKSLKVNGRAVLDEIDKVAGNLTSSSSAKLDKTGGTLSGALTVQGALTAVGGVNFGFTGDDADEWPKFTWYRDLNAKWDEGVIKHSSTRGVFGRAGYGIHLNENREWGLWSTGFKPLFAIKGGTGEAKFSSALTVGGDTAINGNLTVHGKLLTLGLDGNGGGQLVIANNTGDNRIYLEAYNSAGNGSAAELLLTGQAATPVPQLTLKAANTTVSADLGVTGKLSVTGLLQPSAGKTDNSGIIFPRDPGGGGGDAGWLRYYPRSGESCTLELGTSNDADDHIALMPSGCVGINTYDPKRKLHVDNSEIHAGGTAGGFSFSSRDSNSGAFVDVPANGERWVMYAAGGVARIWSGSDKLTISSDGTTRVTGPLSSPSLGITHYVAQVTQSFNFSVANAWGDVPQLSITFSLARDASVQAFYQLTAFAGSGVLHLVTRLVLDNVEIPLSRAINGNVQYWSNASLWAGRLAAGNHTIKVQYRTPSAGSALNPGDDWEKGVLNLMVFGT